MLFYKDKSPDIMKVFQYPKVPVHNFGYLEEQKYKKVKRMICVAPHLSFLIRHNFAYSWILKCITLLNN